MRTKLRWSVAMLSLTPVGAATEPSPRAGFCLVTDKSVHRRLAAILVADVVGYSRLMEADEAGTLAELKERHKAILDPVVRDHGGRIVKFMGDGVLVEFSSAVKAVEAAVDLQQRFVVANDDVPDERRILLRIGINLGDVIGEGSDIYGDGVNIAARLEALAEPGGVCLSGNVAEQITGKLVVALEDLGDKSLKNVTRLVRVFRLTSTPRLVKPSTAVERTRPSIAVLPFANMSGDPEQEYFSDGITEDLITELSRFRHLLVVARNSSYTYKGRPVNMGTVRRELGVDFVVEGSVRKAGNHIRITAQLIDTATGSHSWAERYDRQIEDIFAVQDEVVRAIAAAVPGQLDRHATDVARRKPPANLTAFDYLLRGRGAMHYGPDVFAAIENLGKALIHDGQYALAHAHMASAHAYSLFVTDVNADATEKLAVYHAREAARLGDRDPEVLYAISNAYLNIGQCDLADQYSLQAVEINTSDPRVHNNRALALTYLGELEKAKDCFATSFSLLPLRADEWRNEGYCDYLFMSEQYDKFVTIMRRWVSYPPHMLLELAAAQAMLGFREEARESMRAFAAYPGPKANPSTFVRAHVRMCKLSEHKEMWLEGYRKAGIDV